MNRQAKALSAATLSLFVLLLLAASPAQASKGLVEAFGSTGSGQGGKCLPADPVDCLNAPEDVAVNSATGDIFVADRGDFRIVRFGANGEFERTWGWDVDPANPSTEFEICVAPGPCQAGVKGRDEIGQLWNPAQIALDQVNGTVYVAGPDELRIQKFTEDGDVLGEISGGLLEMRAQHGGIALAVKPGSNTLLAADRIGISETVALKEGTGALTYGRVLWLDQAGNKLLNFDPGDRPASLGPLGAGIVGLGSDSAGDIYGVQGAMATGFPGEVRRWSAFGSLEGLFAPDQLRHRGAFLLETDPSNDRIYVGRYDREVYKTTADNALLEIAEFDTDGTLIDVHATGMPTTSGIAVNASNGIIYGAAGPSDRILVIDDVPNPPVPAITSVDVTGTTATLNGTIDPAGTDYSTGYHWEYRIEGASAWTTVPVPNVDIGNGNGPVTLDPQILTGLEPNTTYEVRLFAIRTGGAGSAVVADEFTTLTVPPTSVTRSAYPIADTSAQLRGVVNPRKTDAQYYFKYGETGEYGQTTPARTVTATKADVAVYATVAGLDPETTYHYRLIADNGTGGEVAGDDMVFTTRSTAEMAWPARGIELANPPNTGSQNVVALLDRTSDRVLWAAAGGAPGSPTGTVGAFVAERNLATPQGWQSRSILPGSGQLIADGSAPVLITGISADFRSALAFSLHVGRQYIYRYDAEGKRTDLANFPRSDIFNNTLTTQQVTNDLRHYYQLVETRLSGDHPVGGSWQVYDLAFAPPRLVSRLPGNGVPKCGVPEGPPSAAGAGFGEEGLYPMHSEPRHPGEPVKVFFESMGNTCSSASAEEGPPGARELYVRDDGGTDTAADDTTTLISGPQASGAPQTANFIRATTDGREVLYVTTAANDPVDVNGTNDIYSWTVGGGNRCVSCEFAPDADVVSRRGERTVIASADLRRIYFNSEQQLVPDQGQAGSDTNLYYFDRDRPGDGLDYVAQSIADPKTDEISDDGKLLVFRSSSPANTPDPTGGLNQFFSYDAVERGVECITCPPPGVDAGEVAGVPSTSGSIATSAIVYIDAPHILSADGSTFAFSSAVAYVPEDINGGPDIYEWRRDGRLRLVTDGVTEFPRGEAGGPAIQGISADGRNILFTVAAKITGFELEPTRQAFIARIGGGFPPPPAPPEPCVAEACQGPLQPVPGYSEPGSESLRGTGDLKAEPAVRKSCPRGKVRRTRRCVAKAKRKSRARARKSRERARKGRGKARKGQSKARGKRTGKGGNK